MKCCYPEIMSLIILRQDAKAGSTGGIRGDDVGFVRLTRWVFIKRCIISEGFMSGCGFGVEKVGRLGWFNL